MRRFRSGIAVLGVLTAIITTAPGLSAAADVRALSSNALASSGTTPTVTATTTQGNGTPTPTPTGTASTAAANCPDRSAPPPAIDTSEKPAPGHRSPAPLPVPSTPVGGDRLGGCGYILPAGAPALPKDLGFESWVIFDENTGHILAAKDPHARQRPASLIKMLLALVVLRELDMKTVITGNTADANQQGTRVGIGPGGKYTVEQLLHGLLMHSGNDVAYALAVKLGGVSTAMDKMNALARQLGATDTRVESPSGLDAAGMCTSSYDLALIFHTALADKRFAEIVHTNQYPFPGFGKNPGFVVSNDNQLLRSYPGDIGGKTGFTDDAQHTYANAAQRGGSTIGLIMMRNNNHLDGMYRNGRELMDYGFALSAKHTSPVGQLVSGPQQDSTAGAPGALAAGTGDDTGSSGSNSLFGSAAILIAAAVLVLLIGALIGVRSRNASRRKH